MTDHCIAGYAAIDTLPDELLLKVFDFCLCDLGDWETLVHVCQRWRSIVFSAPPRLRLQLLCSGRTPVRERLHIWPKFLIRLIVFSGFYEVDDHIIAALERNDRIHEIHVDCVSNDELAPLVEAMEVSFPALTSLHLKCNAQTAQLLHESFLGGSAPNLQSLHLKNVTFPALPNLLLSIKHLVDLSLSDITRSMYETMVDCLSSLTRLETLLVEFRFSQRKPYPTSRRPPPTIRTVLSVLTSLTFYGVMGYLDHLFTHIDAPLLEVFDVSFFNTVDFNDLQLSPFIGRTKMFEGFDQAHMDFRDDLLNVMLSSRNGITGGMSLTLSTEWRDLVWNLCSLTQARRDKPSNTRLKEGRYLPPWTKDMEISPWLNVLCIFTTVESLYLSTGLFFFFSFFFFRIRLLSQRLATDMHNPL